MTFCTTVAARSTHVKYEYDRLRYQKLPDVSIFAVIIPPVLSKMRKTFKTIPSKNSENITYRA